MTTGYCWFHDGKKNSIFLFMLCNLKFLQPNAPHLPCSLTCFMAKCEECFLYQSDCTRETWRNRSKPKSEELYNQKLCIHHWPNWPWAITQWFTIKLCTVMNTSIKVQWPGKTDASNGRWYINIWSICLYYLEIFIASEQGDVHSNSSTDLRFASLGSLSPIPTFSF